MRVEKVIKYVIGLLEEKLPAELAYHTSAHTLDVIEAAFMLCRLEAINDQDQELILTAAALHDTGYIVKYKNNEKFAAMLAKEILPQHGYSAPEIEAVNNCIFATKVPQTPNNALEEIVCDADLDYLGREDYCTISQKLRTEWINFAQIGKEEAQWNQIQYSFLSSHHYFTKSASKLRNELKAIHLKEIKAKL